MIKDFWKLVYSNTADISFQNETIDVVRKDCFVNKNITLCCGNLIMAVLGLATLFKCSQRLVKFYGSFRTGNLHYLIFCSAWIETLFLFLKWAVLVRLYHFEFVSSVLRMFQLVTLCHLNWSIVLHQNERIMRSIIRPLFGAFIVFCTVIAVLAISLDFSSWIECIIPHWIILSLAEFLYIQIYLITGCYVTKKISSLNNTKVYKREQKIHLWSVIGVYEVSAIVTVCYYVTLQFLGDEKIGCSGIFSHVQEIFSPIYTSVMIIRYLFPIWVMISVFQPARGYLSTEESFGMYRDVCEPLLASSTSSPAATNYVKPNCVQELVTSIPVNRRNSCSDLLYSVFAFCITPRLSSSAPKFRGTDSDAIACHQPDSNSKQDRGFSVNQYPEENITCSGGEKC